MPPTTRSKRRAPSPSPPPSPPKKGKHARTQSSASSSKESSSSSERRADMLAARNAQAAAAQAQQQAPQQAPQQTQQQAQPVQQVRWNDTWDRQLLLLVMNREVDPIDYAAYATRFPGVEPRAVYERLRELRREQTALLINMPSVLRPQTTLPPFQPALNQPIVGQGQVNVPAPSSQPAGYANPEDFEEGREDDEDDEEAEEGEVGDGEDDEEIEEGDNGDGDDDEDEGMFFRRHDNRRLERGLL